MPWFISFSKKLLQAAKFWATQVKKELTRGETEKKKSWMREREREREKHTHTNTHTHTYTRAHTHTHETCFAKKLIAAQQPKYVPNKILSGCRVYNFDTLTSLAQRSGAKLWWLAKVLFWSIPRMQALFGVFLFFLFFSCQSKNCLKTITWTAVCWVSRI